MERYAPKAKDLASRDVVSRSMEMLKLMRAEVLVKRKITYQFTSRSY